MPRAEVIVPDDRRLGRRVRGFLAEKIERDLARLPAECDIYDFGPERDRLLRRLADLKAGRPVTFYGWQLRPALRAPGMQGRTLYMATRTGVVPAVYERRDGVIH